MKTLFRSNTVFRGVATSVAAVVAIGIYTQLILPGTGGGRGTPAAVLFNGLVYGLLNALTAAGIVLIYRTTRVINFAQTAIGAAGGAMTFQLLQFTKVPFLIALPIGLIVAALLGLVFDIVVVARFANAPRLILTVATIAAAELFGTAAPQAVNSLPFFPKSRDALASVGVVSVRSKLPLPGYRFYLGHFKLPFGFPELFAIELCGLALLLVAAFFRYTRAGVAVRAIAENTERASLLGISAGAMSMIVWTFAGLLSGIGVILTGSLTLPGAAAGIAPSILLPALAAAVIARFRNLPVVVAAAVGISILEFATVYSFNKDSGLLNMALFVVVAVGLLIERRVSGRRDEASGASWEATEEQRPVPKELRGIGAIRVTRYSLIAIGVAGVALYPFLASTGLTNLGGVIAVNAIVALSLVVLTGWAGQVSLGQYGFVAIGGVVAGSLFTRVGLPFWLAIIVATVVTGLFAVIVGIPALRIKGLFLAVTTFAFAIGVHDVLFQKRYFGWLLPADVKRPRLFFLNFDDEKSMYFLCVLGLILAIVVVVNLRRSRFGRILIAVRENEANLQSFGVAAVRTKLQAFAVSGAMAGFAGALFTFQQRGAGESSFVPEASIAVFLAAVVGGVTSPLGVLLGVAYFNLDRYFFGSNIVLQIVRPFAVLILLFISPGGLVSLINRLRDGVLRIVAQRRQIIVPSLFADFDPEAIEKQLIPLAELANGSSALAQSAEPFAMASELYAGRGERIIDKLGPAKQTAEAKAIGAAVSASEQPEPVGS